MTAGQFIYNIFACNSFPPYHMLVPACGGTETPLRTITGQWVMYVFCPCTNHSFYSDLRGNKIEPNFYSNLEHTNV